MGKQAVCVAVATMVVLGAVCMARAATQAEAKGLVEETAAYWKAYGQATAIREINSPSSQFNKGGLSVFANSINGIVLANGSNPDVVGKNQLGITDAAGKPFVKECAELAKTKGSGWVEYTWTNPATGKTQSRMVWIRRIEGTDVYIGSGLWK